MTLSLYIVPFSRYSTSKFLGFDLDLWPLRVTEVEHIFTIWKPIYDFLFNSHWHFLSISYRFEIFDFKVFRVWPWPLTFRGHLRSKIFSPFESPYMPSYLTSICTFSLSRTVFEIFDFKVFRVWPWPLSFRGHLRSNIFSPFESPYMTSYLTPIDTFSLYRTVFEIFDIKVFRVWPWPLTFRGHPRSKIFSTIWKLIYDFLFNSHWHFLSISYRFFRYSTSKFLGFDLDLWPLGVTLRSKIFSPFESPYITSYLTPIDTFSLSRNVFEIFDFKVF